MIRVVHPGSRIRMLTFYPSRIPDPGVKKAPDPGSISATLATKKFNYTCFLSALRSSCCSLRRGISSSLLARSMWSTFFSCAFSRTYNIKIIKLNFCAFPQLSKPFWVRQTEVKIADWWQQWIQVDSSEADPLNLVVRIRICGSVPPTNGSVADSGSCYFRQWPSRW